MANKNWSDLYKKSDGFTSVPVSATNEAFKVQPGQRLIVDASTPVTIDPSGLTTNDQRFQIVDRLGKFKDNPVTIKGDVLPNALAPDGGDLILDTAPVAGQTWEFFVNEKVLCYAGVIENGA
jgi:hypothetical protein